MRRVAVAGLASVSLGGLLIGSSAYVAGAAPSGSPAGAIVASPVAESTTTLPLFGAPLTVDITAGPDGALTSVSVNPADGMTATIVKPNHVRFVNEDGTGAVKVSSKHGGQQISARAQSLSDLIGPGSWSGDVFGAGADTTVTYEVAATAEGAPDVINVASSDPTAVISEVFRKDGDHAAVKVLFTSGTQARAVWIHVGVGTHDGQPKAMTTIYVSREKGLSLPAAEVAGAQTWNGTLCDGTAAQVAYTVAVDGTVSNVSATPVTAAIEVDGSALSARFSDHEKVSIRVKGDDGELRVAVKERIWCDSGDPVVNTPIDEDRDHDRWEGDRDRGHDDGDGRRGDRGGDRDGDWGHRGDRDGHHGDGDSRSDRDDRD